MMHVRRDAPARMNKVMAKGGRASPVFVMNACFAFDAEPDAPLVEGVVSVLPPESGEGVGSG